MHIFFSGIGGAGIGPLALIAKQAGYEVSGSDKQSSSYIENLGAKGITDVQIGQTREAIEEHHKKHPIDWLVYSSALPKENPDHPELVFAAENNIKHTKRDEFLNELLKKTGQKMIAVAGTHGKTTTTAMCIWMFKQLDIPVSYSVGAKLSFGGIGEFDAKSEYFVYEADEYDRNFLSFKPETSLITGIAYDHPDIYPTKDDYSKAFREFIASSQSTFIWDNDATTIEAGYSEKITVLDKANSQKIDLKLPGKVNRENAALVIHAVLSVDKSRSYAELAAIMDRFPGVSRRFEKIVDNVYTDYAHTPEKIHGALQLTNEIAGDNVVVVYEGLHNTRQHFIKNELKTLFEDTKKVYVVPSYLAREDKDLETLTPEKICETIEKPTDCEPAALDQDLKTKIQDHAAQNDLVISLTAGGGGSLDEWLRKEFNAPRTDK